MQTNTNETIPMRDTIRASGEHISGVDRARWARRDLVLPESGRSGSSVAGMDRVRSWKLCT